MQLLTDCRKVLEACPQPRIATRDLAARLTGLPDRDFEHDLSAHQLGMRLAQFGIHPRPMRPDGKHGKSTRVIVFKENGQYLREWADAFARYL